MKKIYRSRKDYIIGGVCGGIADYFDIDPTLVRILAILIIFLGGVGLVAYVLAWIIIPPNPDQLKEEKNDSSNIKNDNYEEIIKKDNNQKNIWGGLLLIFLGLYFLLRNFFPRIILLKFWPVIFIIIGVILIFQSFIKKSNN
ncbi:MAG: PspC domain-containing protein [Atribacterota bacterium]|nr:PspC domain-containing protein [Atribacterota bacterium]